MALCHCSDVARPVSEDTLVHLTLQFDPQVEIPKRKMIEVARRCLCWLSFPHRIFHGGYGGECSCSALLKVSIQLFNFCELIHKWFKLILDVPMSINGLVKKSCYDVKSRHCTTKIKLEIMQRLFGILMGIFWCIIAHVGRVQIPWQAEPGLLWKKNWRSKTHNFTSLEITGKTQHA